jgi:hypothetical protein
MSIEALLFILLLVFGVGFVLNRVEVGRMTRQFELESHKD